MNLTLNFDLKKLHYSKEQMEQFALFAIIGVAVIAGFWFALFSPGFNSIARMKKKCAELTAKIDDAQEKIKNTKRINERYAAYEVRMTELQAAMPRESDTSWIVATVGDIEKKLKVKAEKIVPYTEKVQPGTQQFEENPLYDYHFAQITLNAGYHQIGQFINALEGRVKYPQIVNISVDGDENSPYQHHAEIKIKYPVLKQPLIE